MAESKVIIFGANGHEYAKIKRKNQNKRYFETKRQLYRVYPEGYVRVKIDGLEGKSDAECIIYDECSIEPYDNPSDIDYSSTAFEEDIWEDKQMSTPYERKRLSWQNIGGFFTQYGKYLPFVAIGIVVAVAFIGQFLEG